LEYAFRECSDYNNAHWLSGDARDKIVSGKIETKFRGSVHVSVSSPVMNGTKMVDFADIKNISGSCKNN